MKNIKQELEEMEEIRKQMIALFENWESIKYKISIRYMRFSNDNQNSLKNFEANSRARKVSMELSKLLKLHRKTTIKIDKLRRELTKKTEEAKFKMRENLSFGEITMDEYRRFLKGIDNK